MEEEAMGTRILIANRPLLYSETLFSIDGRRLRYFLHSSKSNRFQDQNDEAAGKPDR
ncbi:MAG TPA: hypothetical protein VLZ03_13390 [Thermodesulfobacteriota bacterium]|nr:hypothetical protein [Thermodesulfobacteriota bacterium]